MCQVNIYFFFFYAFQLSVFSILIITIGCLSSTTKQGLLNTGSEEFRLSEFQTYVAFELEETKKRFAPKSRVSLSAQHRTHQSHQKKF